MDHSEFFKYAMAGGEADKEQTTCIVFKTCRALSLSAYPHIIGQTFQHGNFTSNSDAGLVDENGRERC